MKTLAKFMALGVIAACSSTALAQNVEKVTLKNGSVLEGYLAEQRPGKDFTVQSTNAMVFASEDSLLNVTQQQIELSMLPQAWTDWAIKNKLAEPNKDGQTINLSTLQFKHSIISNVYVQERGITVKFVDMNNRSYIFPWSLLGMTSKNLRASNQFSGIVDELVMTNGKHFEGQVTDQTPGKGIKIIFEDGQVQSFNYADIAQIISKPLNPKMTIWEQSQLLDEVVLKSTGETVKGIISSRHIGKDYTFMMKNGQSRVVNATDVAIFRKLKNEEYKSAQDRVMAEGEVLINGDAKNAYFFNLESTETCVVLDQEQASMQLSCGDTIVVEANIGNPLATITIAKAQLKEIETVNAKGKKIKEQKYVVTLYDLLQSKSIGVREVTSLGHVKFTLPITESGDYVMQIQGKEGYIVIYVPKDNSIQ